MRLLSLFLVAACLLCAEETPTPPKADLPYLLMAGNLVPTEAIESKQDETSGGKNQGTTYWVPGEHSTAKTPLAFPIFVLKVDHLDPERLAIYPFAVRNGRREITFSRKEAVKPYTLTLTKISEGVYRMEVNEELPAGEYAITPNESNQTFCFAVY